MTMNRIHTLSRPLDLHGLFRPSFSGVHHLLEAMRPRPQFPVDLFEDESGFHARFELPGISRRQINIQAENGHLTVSVNHTDDDGGSESRAIERSLPIPDGADTAKISARLKNGLLTLTIPKMAEEKPKSIEVK